MILSTENGELRARLGDRGAIELLAGAGFDAIDYNFSPWLERGEIWLSDNFAAQAREVRAIAEANGVYFNQAHGPFLFDETLFPDYEKQVLPLFRRCFAVCEQLGVPHMIVHPLHHLPYRQNKQRLWEMNLAFYRLLLPLARESGVKIALENMYQYDPRRGVLTRDVFASPAEFAAFYDELDDPDVICCVDTGHCPIVGEDTPDMLRGMGGRVRALHLNDNLFRTDDHVVPGHGLLDWDAVTRALAEIDYAGDMTFEVLNIYRAYDDSFLPVSAKYLHDVGRWLIGKVEAHKMRLRAE